LIRKLNSNDSASIEKILIETKHFNDDEIKIAMELIDVYISDAKQTDYIIQVCEDDETKNVCGYICYGKRPLTDSTYDLYWIAVDANIHGKGIGSSLVKFMETDLKKNYKARLVLIETSGKHGYENERKFYAKNGYDVQTTIKDFYRQGDDLVVFRKYI